MMGLHTFLGLFYGLWGISHRFWRCLSCRRIPDAAKVNKQNFRKWNKSTMSPNPVCLSSPSESTEAAPSHDLRSLYSLQLFSSHLDASSTRAKSCSCQTPFVFCVDKSSVTLLFLFFKKNCWGPGVTLQTIQTLILDRDGLLKVTH